MCIRQAAAPLPATASSAPGAASADTSFTSDAPASIARRITMGFRVSTETGTASEPARRSMSGITRRSSSTSSTAAAPGRVDSPPTSTMAAPSATSSCARASAAGNSRKRPPSEKESGVTLMTPMTTGRSRSSRKRPHWRRMGVRPAGAGVSVGKSGYAPLRSGWPAAQSPVQASRCPGRRFASLSRPSRAVASARVPP